MPTSPISLRGFVAVVTDWLAEMAKEGPFSDKERAYFRKLVERYRFAYERERKKRGRLEARLEKQKRPLSILVIPDGHADLNDQFGEPNDRFSLVGKLAAKRKPDVVIQLGDLGDFASLAVFDKPGSKAASTRSVLEDIESTRDAVQKLTAPIRNEKDYSPRLIMLDGNHEYRITRATTSDDRRWEGVIHPTDLGREDEGWEVFPYEVPVEIGGICFSHNLSRPNARNPIAGKYMAATLIAEGGSAVVGHSHIWSHHEGRRWDGAKRFALSAGCFFERDLEWAKGSNQAWWRGVVMLHDVWDGYATVEPIPLGRIREEFGG